MATPDFDKLVALMADFENGADFVPDNPFDFGALTELPAPVLAKMMDSIGAFQQGTVEDTAEELAGKGDHVAFSVAGFMQGLCIGYEYARRGMVRENT